jgi:prophage regulatory protein
MHLSRSEIFCSHGAEATSSGATAMNDKKRLLQPDSRAEPIPPFLRLPVVIELTGLARSTIYRMVAEHTFPAPVRLAKRAVAWRQDDVRRWTLGRPRASQ